MGKGYLLKAWMFSTYFQCPHFRHPPADTFWKRMTTGDSLLMPVPAVPNDTFALMPVTNLLFSFISHGALNSKQFPAFS